MVPDYYERLGVDPAATAAEIDAALRKKQPAWSMGTRNPKTRHANQLFLDEIPALRRALMGSAETRAAYDAELAAAQIADRDEKLDDLQRLIRIRAAKGGLGAPDFALLRAEASRLGLEPDVLDRLTRLIPKLTDDAVHDAEPEKDAEPPADVLDPSTRRQIRLALEHLGRRDLYDALGLFRDAPLSVIAARADEERQRWMKKAQVTAEKTAWLEAISHAQSHLGATKSRARYDRTLMLEAEERFDQTADFALQGRDRLDAGTRAILIDEAGALGISPDRASRLLQRACRRCGAALDLSAADAAMASVAGKPKPAAASAGSNGAYKVVRCRNCAGVSEVSPVARRAGPARCKHCGASLKWECPVCRRSSWVDQPRCACGFRLVLREALVRHFSAALHAFRSHDLETARRHLEKVQSFAPHHVGARNGMAKIQERRVEIEQARMVFELAEAGGRMTAALKALEAWRRIDDPGSAEIRKARELVADRVRRAEGLAAKARKLERVDPPQARRIYRMSLELAADLPNALDGLSRCPPDAPTNLEARALGDRVQLSWTPPEADGLGPLTFAIIRKRGELPKHPGDGTRIAEVSTAEFDDRRVEPAETVSYAVLSKRGAAESLAAVAAGPILFLPDVEDLRVATREGEVSLSWVVPRGATEVRVVRNQEAAPKNPRDGARVPAARDQAVDRDVADDKVYHYGVFAIYATPDGRRFPSPGVTVSARPSPPVPPPGPPRIMLAPGGQIRLDWIEPARGSVRLLRSLEPVPHPPGAILSLAEAESLAGEWVELTGPNRAEDFDPPAAGSCRYTLFASLGHSLVVGHGASLSRVADPSGLRAIRLGNAPGEAAGGRVQLRWNWAADTVSARIVARQGTSPVGPDDPAALGFTVTRAEYDRFGSWLFHLPASSPDEPSDFELHPADGGPLPPRLAHWHVRVYSVADLDGATCLSPGLEPSAETVVPGPHPEITVAYQLKRPWLPGRPWSVSMRTDPPGASVPPMVVVANARAVPLSAEDGDVVARLPAGRDGASHPIPADPRLAFLGLRAFVDPGYDPDALFPIRLRHPEAGATRV
ncbi:MAG: fibronectin type III domain-containing protein [Paludisphaera borealis]|uniref:fibronectin type III domain-containing protein n=1 Tax=Paludisphaera borealis TaxID=1387353 RepID=UPI0028411DC1|nr:fibronectin type III domain-containing protein [Paludisphaera borealis]MDR3622275.1 fibronectin type III domain-containing protein [Paludisphaera borealis]